MHRIVHGYFHTSILNKGNEDHDLHISIINKGRIVCEVIVDHRHTSIVKNVM